MSGRGAAGTADRKPGPFLSRRARRGVFIAFALTLFALTHWPKMRIEVPGIERPDLVVHLVVFGIWTALCIGAALFGPARSIRNVLASGLLAAAYASADEASQMIPLFGRHAAWDDLRANLTGVAIATALGAGLALLRPLPATPAPTEAPG